MELKEYIRESIAIAMIVLGIVILVSLLTYSPEDYSEDYVNGSDTVQYKNKCGFVGMKLSRFLYKSIGVAGYALVFFIFMWGGLLAFSKKTVQFFWYRCIASLLLVFSFSLFASLNTFSSIDPSNPVNNKFYPLFETFTKNHINLGDIGLGGEFGYVSAIAATKTIGRIGAEIFSIGLIFISLEFSFAFLFSSLFISIYKWSANKYQAIREKIAAAKKGKKEKTVAEPEYKIKQPPSLQEPAFAKHKEQNPSKPELKKRKDNEKKKKEKQKKILVEIPKSGEYVLPPIDLLEDSVKVTRDKTELQENRASIIEEVLMNFKIEGKVVEINSGPVITQYEIELGAGIRVNSVFKLSDDLSMALQSPGIRIEAPIPGKSTVGIEVPNKESEFVKLKDLMLNLTDQFKNADIPLLIGKDTMGKPIGCDLTSMPHLLIAGATGSGKTVCINSMILSILMLKRPEEVKFIIIDPKMVDMTAYKKIPHLLTPIVTDTQKAEAVLNWAVAEMERRYKLFNLTGARNINTYNKLTKENVFKSMEEAGNPQIYKRGDIPYPLHFVVVVVDELADLMFAAPEIEFSITRIAQKARAAGIHLVLSTQRPSVDVITGLIKSNIPCRIAFQVAAKVDSRTILDQNGAEALLGHGDMLYLPPGSPKSIRAQGAYTSDNEIKSVVEFCKVQSKPMFSKALEKAQVKQTSELKELDEGLEDAIRITLQTQRGSASLLQRKLGFGYNRATALIEAMETLEIVGPYQGSKAREVLRTLEEFEQGGGLQGLLDNQDRG